MSSEDLRWMATRGPWKSNRRFMRLARLTMRTALAISIILLLSLAAPAGARLGPLHAELIVRDSYRSGSGVLVRVEVLDNKGQVERGLWDAVATLSGDSPAVALSTNKVVLYNGLGSALVTFTGTGDFTLSANVNGMQASRQLSSLQGQPVTDVSGSLTGEATNWSGIIHVTDDLTVPLGHTLTVQPGTLVLIDGVASGNNGADINIAGDLQSLGTAAQPVTLTAFDPAYEWGRIDLDDAEPSSFRYTNITLAGHSPGSGHTGAGLVFYARNSNVAFDHCSITDHDGKIGAASGADLTFSHCHLARAVMGPEIGSTALMLEDTFITEMFGSDDNDAIYIHGQRSGQKVELRRGVVADTDDDGIDTLGSSILVEDFIIRDIYDKGVSVNAGGPIFLKNVLIVESGTGVAAKDGNTGGNPQVYIDNCTIVSTDTGRNPSDLGIHAYFKYATSGTIEYFVTNSIILAADPVESDFGDPDPLIRIDYSNLAEPWSGTANFYADPCFADPANGDYRLKSQAGRWNPITHSWLQDETTSPCIDAGDPIAPIAFEPFPNGAIINIGAYAGTTHASKSYFGQPPCQTIIAGDINGDCIIDAKDFAFLARHWLQNNNP